MNEIIDLIEKRTSLRSYSPTPLKRKEVNLIIRSAIRAPTAGNMMMYSIINVEDQKKKEMLVKTCDNQPFIAQAPLVLLFVADLQRTYDYFEHCKVPQLCTNRNIEYRTPQEADLFLAFSDALIAAQNTVIAAESLGIGSCYIGDILENYETHQKMFNLPTLVFPIALICFGYYPEKRGSPVERFDQKYICFNDTYKRLSEDELEDMFAQRTQKSQSNFKDGIENYGQLLYKRKTGAEFSHEMERSVKSALKTWLSYIPGT